MNVSHIVRPALVASLVALPLAACSAGGSQFNPAPLGATPATTFQQQATKVRPDREKLSVYAYAGNCVIYGPTPSGGYEWVPPGCDPAEGYVQSGLWFDKSEKDWFAGVVTASSNTIAVWNQNFKQVSTLTGLTGDPVGIVTDSKADVWATNYPSNTISEFNPGATKPSATYTDANLSSLRYVTVDQNDNVYVSGQSAASGNLEVDEFHGSGFTPITTITGAVGAGIAVSAKTKSLWVCDEGSGTSGTISAYTMPGFKRRMQFKYSGDDTGIAVSSSGKQLAAIDNVPYGSEFNISLVFYDANTGKVLAAGQNLTTFAKAVGISYK